ncbi:MAG: aminotransferase class V-fold PLP-dependent enzyme, partial [Spirochaetota bacterium]
MIPLADPVPPEVLAAQLGAKTRILDFGRYSYRQLVAWDPLRRELVAAYRYILCGDLICADPDSTDPAPEKPGSAGDRPRDICFGYGQLRTSRLFDFSGTMEREVLPCSVELGRSVVNRDAAKGIIGLYCAWAGLGALTREYTHLDNFFGNFSVYSSYPPEAVVLLIRFLERHHRDTQRLLAPKAGLSYEIDRTGADHFTGYHYKENDTENQKDYDKDYDSLLSSMAGLGTAVPPILLSYLGASRNLVYLGAARDDDFGGAVECAILVPLKGLNEKARTRFVDSYTSTATGPVGTPSASPAFGEPLSNLLEPSFKLATWFLSREDELPDPGLRDPRELARHLDASLGADPHEAAEVLERMRLILAQTPSSSSWRFLNQLFGGRVGMASAAEMLAVLPNSSMYTLKAAGAQVVMENEVLGRMCGKVRFEKGEGSFVPGGSSANLVALLLARDRAAPGFRDSGLSERRLIAYTSAEAHYSIPKNAAIAGLGRQNVRLIAVDEQGRMVPAALEAAIKADLASGFKPFFINATAGTTVRGAFDPIRSLAALARKHGLWLHVDGALGGPMVLSTEHRHLVDGSELA